VKRILLDTECWLWWYLHPERLNAGALDAFEARRSPLLLSAASSWEMAIKVSLGKLELPMAIERFVPAQLAEDDIAPLPIAHAHALAVSSLPPHHSDPFDRLLIAQAQVERCAIMTADAQFTAYGVDLLWAAPSAPAPAGRSAARRRR